MVSEPKRPRKAAKPSPKPMVQPESVQEGQRKPQLAFPDWKQRAMERGATGRRRPREARQTQLTTAERLVLEATLDPETWKMSPAEFAAALSMDPAEIARIKRSPAFQEAQLDLMRRRAAEKMPAVLAAWLDSAMIPGSQGYRDRRMFLEAVGMVAPANSGKGGSTIFQILNVGDGAGAGIADRMIKALTSKNALIAEVAKRAAGDDAIPVEPDDEPAPI